MPTEALPRLRHYLPLSPLSRRIVVRAVLLWPAFRLGAAAALDAAEGGSPNVGVQVMVWLLVTGAVTGAVMIDARRRGEPLLLANLGSPPAATVAWAAGVVSVLDWGAWRLIR